MIYKINEKKDRLTIKEIMPCSCLYVECDCGKRYYVKKHDLKYTKSCGCIRKKPKKTNDFTIRKPAVPAAFSDMPLEFASWRSMKSRCNDISGRHSKYYKAKGITVCQEWRDDFPRFYKDMGKRPSKRHTLDRINNNLGYFKENCRWATREEQNRNRIISVYIDDNGSPIHIIDYSKKIGISYALAYYRLRTGKIKRYNP